MIGVRFSPLDSWFFREGTPLFAGAAPLEDVATLFPPHPPTAAGALRAALATARGWSGAGRWPEAFNRVLGDGPDDLGALSLDGPFLLRGDRPLFRVPRHLVGKKKDGEWRPGALLRPGPPVMCDLGDSARLPRPDPAAGDPLTFANAPGHWLTPAGMNAVLKSELPASGDVVSNDSLWSVEPRVGLQRDGETRAAVEGMLYSARHARPKRGVALGLRVSGLPSDWAPPFGRAVPFGGESRLAECAEWKPDLGIRMSSALRKDARRVALIALSPLDIDADIAAGARALDALGGARVVSACLDRPARVGGWNSLARRPLPMRGVLPAGSVLFCETENPPAARDAIAAGGGLVRVGARRKWGFGLAACAAWRDVEETKR